MTWKVFTTILLAMQLALGAATAPIIGVASARGNFRIDNTAVTGNGTVFDGTTVETMRAASDVEMTSGAKMTLGAASRGRIYRDRLVLERGESQLRNGGSFGVEARSLRVISDDARSTGQVSIRDNNRVMVAAVNGNFRVMNAKGVMIASVAAGHALEFEQSAAGATGPTKLSGCVVKRDGHYFITDDTAKITVELQAPDIDKYAGHRVEITGSQIPGATPAGNATQIIQVGALKDSGKKCSAAAAKGAAAGAAAGGAAAGGAAAGAGGTVAATVGMAVATKAIIAGVIVAAATTGTAVGITKANDDGPSISN